MQRLQNTDPSYDVSILTHVRRGGGDTYHIISTKLMIVDDGVLTWLKLQFAKLCGSGSKISVDGFNNGRSIKSGHLLDDYCES
jgi:hypothetical protein